MLKKHDRQWKEKQINHLKWVAWANIFAQVAFPVAAAFTPAVATAKSEHQVRETQPHTGQTQPYRLSAGESVKTVAKRHGLSVTELKKLNQQRTFHKPFAKLGAGDEIDVPHSASDALLADSLKATTDAPATENSAERWLASTASQAASMIKSGNMVDNAKNQLRNMAVGEANQAVRDWLQRYGNVKIQANVDDRGRLDGSQFDMLLPLYDTAKHLTFTQFGLRHIDSRTTANVGLGQRHFFDDGMFGYNAFLDHDITRDHTRFGIGAEYARDFMKFAANGYFRASGWKDGKKLTEYEERPANGFDLRAEGYIPTYPQLGGKLTYEQYFGNEVGLLSEKQRQKNPAAFTLGVNYTPIPLVTLGLDRRQSASGGGDTLFNLGLNYEIGTPWSKQIDPDAVAFKRTLQGGRYDLVDRNNQIVLEYRKKILIRLMMEPRIIGRGGAIIPLNVTVSTKHQLKDIVWDTSNLVSGGGKLEAAGTGAPADSLAAETVRGGTHYLLTLPPYQAEGNNTYSLSGVAYDTQGNASERVEAQILVTASAVNPAGSGFEPANKSMVADGKTQTVIRLKLTDKNGKPVSGAAGSISLTDDKSKLTGDGKDPLLGTEIKEVPEGSGIYEVTATAGTKRGKWTIKPTVDGHELPSTVIDFGDSLANMIDTDQTKFEPDNGTLNKENEETDIVLKLVDKEGKPITGAVDKIKLTEDRSDLYGEEPYPHVTGIKEDPAGSGIYKAKVVAGKKKGTLKVTPVVDGKELKPTQVVFGQSLADIVDTKGSAFIPATNVLASDNEDSTIMTLELKDKKGQPIRNAKDSITFEDNGDQLTGDGKNKPTIDKVWEEPENSGIYKVKVKAGDKNGHWKITTKIDGVALEKPTEITFDPNKADLVDPNKSTFVAKESELPNDGDTTVIEVDLKDHEGKVITGAENSIKMIPDDHGLYGSGKKMPTVGKFKETPPGSGHYQATVTAGDKKGKWELAPEVFGKKIEKTTTITFGKSLADKLNLKSPEVDPADGSTALPADGHTKKTLRITLKDGDNNPIYGAKDSIIVTGDYSTLKGDGKDPVIDKVKEVGDGVYEVVITAGTKTGNWAVTTTVDGKKNPQPLELEFDVNKAPSVVISHLEGELAIGKTLTANYKFNSNDSNTVDRSFYVWGAKGTTAARVIELAEKAGAKEPIELEQENGEGRVNGKPITYIIQENDKHKVLEVSILAANDANLRAKGPETMAVDDPRTATTITGGNGSGGVPDPNAVPEVDELDLTGKLELSSTLTVSYKFMPNGGDARDKSQFAWKILSKEGDAMNWQDVDQPAQGDNKGQAKLILEKELELEISGEVIVMSILPANFTGQQNLDGIKKVTTVPGSPGNNTSGGNNGTIVDPDAKPIVKNLELHGRLQVGDTIRGEYAFGANKGDPVDHSVYTWYRIKGKPSPDKLKIVPDEENKEKILGPIAVTDNGKVPLYTLQKSEMEHFIRLEVQPMHGGQPLGDKLVVTTNIDKEDNGNKNLSGGSDSYGRVIDPDLGPEISDLKIGIEVEGDKKYLTATYQFKPKQGADDEDKSRFLWGEYAVGDEFTTRRDVSRVGRTVEKNQAVAAQPHKVPRYEKPLDELSGKIIALSVQGKNRSNMDGNTEDADTKKDAKELGDNVNTDGVIKGKADVIEAKMNKTEAKARVNLLNKDQPLSDEESARLTIKTTKGGANIGGVPVSIEMTYEVRTPNNLNHKDFPDSDRPKVTAKLEVEDKKGVLYDNPNIQDRKITYTGHTDENGDLIIKVTDPDGKGVKTKINVTTGGAPDENLDITFTVITSPNVDGATYYGHMENTITTENGLVFHRPTIKKEHLGTVDVSSPVVDGEIWTYHRYTKVMGYCTERGLQTPSTSEYLDLAKESNEKFGVEKNAVKRKYGWPTKYEYYASNIVPQGEPGAGYRRTVDLEILTVGRNNNSQLVACRNP